MSEEEKVSCTGWTAMLYGFVDGELDSVHAAEFESHLARAPIAGKRWKNFMRVKRTIGQDGVKWQAPPDVRSHILAALSLENGAASAAFSPVSAEPLWRRILRYARQWSYNTLAGGLGGELTVVRECDPTGAAHSERDRGEPCAINAGQPPDRCRDVRPAHGQTMVQR